MPGRPIITREKATPAPQALPHDLLDETIGVWQPYSAQPLSREDAREILANVSGLFRILREWAEEDRRAAESGAVDEGNSP